MTAALDIIRKEHRAITRVLHMLNDIVEDDVVLARGVESGLIASILHYLHVFPYGIHHPKEEQHLFPAVSTKDTEAASAVATLAAEHATGYAILSEARRALADVDGRKEFDRLRRAIRNCVTHETDHMAREERDILPVAERVLDRDTLAAIARTFAASDKSEKSVNIRKMFKALLDPDK